MQKHKRAGILVQQGQNFKHHFLETVEQDNRQATLCTERSPLSNYQKSKIPCARHFTEVEVHVEMSNSGIPNAENSLLCQTTLSAMPNKQLPTHVVPIEIYTGITWFPCDSTAFVLTSVQRQIFL